MKEPMERRLVIQDASWSRSSIGAPQKLLSFGSAREGRAGPVNPITAPLRRQPRVAHTVAMICRRREKEDVDWGLNSYIQGQQ